MKKTKIILLIFVFAFCLAPKVFASTITLVPSKNSVGIGEQFYVDVMLDPQNVSTNGLEGSVTFANNNVSFVRAETGKSLISFWVEEPKLTGNTISFAGIIPTGFAGVIDPFNPAQKMPGLMLRLVFAGAIAGEETFSAPPFSVTLNDGLGTILNTASVNTSVNIQNVSNQFTFKNPEDLNPELEASVTEDPNLFNGRYALIFNARDSGTGIKSVMIKEGNRDWKEISSPYLLEDQTRHSTITLQAVNFSGGSIIVVINPLPSKLFSAGNIAIIIVFLIILLFIIRKIFLNAKKRKNQQI